MAEVPDLQLGKEKGFIGMLTSENTSQKTVQLDLFCRHDNHLFHVSDIAQEQNDLLFV